MAKKTQNLFYFEDIADQLEVFQHQAHSVEDIGVNISKKNEKMFMSNTLSKGFFQNNQVDQDVYDPEKIVDSRNNKKLKHRDQNDITPRK